MTYLLINIKSNQFTIYSRGEELKKLKTKLKMETFR